jgi:multidrug efflux pump subunit AcrA (membrane-fusion protein)
MSSSLRLVALAVLFPSAMATAVGTPAPDVPATVTCPVEGATTIRSLLPAGRHVARGEVICELDPSAVQHRLDQQTLELRRAEAELASARFGREAAELAVKEIEAEASQECNTLRHEVAIAEKQLELARTLLDESSRGKAGDDAVAAARTRVAHEERNLAEARDHLTTYEQTTRPKRAKELADALARASAAEHTRQEERTQADTANGRLRRQVADCRIVAPVAGTLLYVRPPGTIGEGHDLIPRKGTVVHERQPLFRIVPDKPPSPTRRPVDNGAGPG